MTLFQERPIRPMMAKTGEPFDSEHHLFEVKWDGLRALLFLKNGKVELQNRNLRDVTTSYPELNDLGKGIKATSAILDGEVVVLNEKGLPDFGKMQTRFGHIDQGAIELVRNVNPAVYVAFDLLHLDGKDIVKFPLETRKDNLRKTLIEGSHLLFGDHVTNDGSLYYSQILALGFEGLIAKEKSSEYLPGIRSGSWIKIKGIQTIDAVVVGYSAGEGARTSSFGSLVVAMYDKEGKLVHVGNVGGGFDNKTLDDLRPKLDKIVSKTPILKEPIDAPLPVVWVKPKVVIEILYLNFTHEKKLRFPRFQRLRPDKRPAECILDEDILSR